MKAVKNRDDAESWRSTSIVDDAVGAIGIERMEASCMNPPMLRRGEIN